MLMQSAVAGFGFGTPAQSKCSDTHALVGVEVILAQLLVEALHYEASGLLDGLGADTALRNKSK